MKLTTPILPAAAQGDLQSQGTWFNTAETALAEVAPQYDLGRLTILDATNASDMADVLGKALTFRGSKPLTVGERLELTQMRDAFSAGYPPVITGETITAYPIIAEAAQAMMYEGIGLPDDHDKMLVWYYQNVRNLAMDPTRQDFDRVGMAKDEARDAQPKINYEADTVRLADDEYGVPIMWMAALEYFAKNPDCRFVEVREHGGWFLGYCRDDAQIWATANDVAQIDAATPRPSGWSGKSLRRDDNFAAQVRQAAAERDDREWSDERRVNHPIVIWETQHAGESFTRWERTSDVSASWRVGDTEERPSGVKATVRSVIEPRTAEQREQDQAATVILRGYLAMAKGIAPLDHYSWQDGAPRYQGRPCWGGGGAEFVAAVEMTMARLDLNQALVPITDLHEAASRRLLDKIPRERLTLESLTLTNDAGETVWAVALRSRATEQVPVHLRPYLEMIERRGHGDPEYVSGVAQFLDSGVETPGKGRAKAFQLGQRDASDMQGHIAQVIADLRADEQEVTAGIPGKNRGSPVNTMGSHARR